MLQTVRDYARSQLDPNREEGRARPARRLLPGAGGQDGPALRGGGQRQALEALDADIGNIQLAVESLLTDGRQQTVADLAWSLWLYCWARAR